MSLRATTCSKRKSVPAHSLPPYASKESPYLLIHCHRELQLSLRSRSSIQFIYDKHPHYQFHIVSKVSEVRPCETEGKMKSSRRAMLSKWSKGLALAGAAGIGSKAFGANRCEVTQRQPEGPFYPIYEQDDVDNDLTRVRGSRNMASGEVIFLHGAVMDQHCRPVEGAIVEIWQAAKTGKYNHPSDPNPAELDPHFQYWGIAKTDSVGGYTFKTIKPGKYRASDTWVRPPHIHMKVHLRGFRELITQVYFEEESGLNSKDLILNELDGDQKANVVVSFVEGQDGYRYGEFNITLHRF
jgi:protocatechuate 3,4-dioxygenase beta subunit